MPENISQITHVYKKIAASSATDDFVFMGTQWEVSGF